TPRGPFSSPLPWAPMADSPQRSNPTHRERHLKDVGLRAAPLALLVAVGIGGSLHALTREPVAAPDSPTDAPPPQASLEQLRASADDILATIGAQESKKDATCWSSVRMIEGFSLGRQMTPAAEVA